RFREDLFFRLNVIPIHLPPLRERREDIPALMNHFLKRYCQENGRGDMTFSAETRRLFLEYPWPGNVRELQNAIERAVVLSSDATLKPEHFTLQNMLSRPVSGDMVAVPMGVTVAEMEKELILRTLAHQNDNRTKTAEVLGISVRTLRNKLKEYKEE
ncbi:MAG TPA: sigma-54-dependent Fis family transcriptional regulator, partial [Candidatus Hydrogenedentes bacterium]|nr:sigma-54-dependent Fis family transcriptional regulator [Candidatus Hydrogenedentota bacterium]